MRHLPKNVSRIPWHGSSQETCTSFHHRLRSQWLWSKFVCSTFVVRWSLRNRRRHRFWWTQSTRSRTWLRPTLQITTDNEILLLLLSLWKKRYDREWEQAPIPERRRRFACHKVFRSGKRIYISYRRVLIVSPIPETADVSFVYLEFSCVQFQSYRVLGRNGFLDMQKFGVLGVRFIAAKIFSFPLHEGPYKCGR